MKTKVNMSVEDFIKNMSNEPESGLDGDIFAKRNVKHSPSHLIYNFCRFQDENGIYAVGGAMIQDSQYFFERVVAMRPDVIKKMGDLIHTIAYPAFYCHLVPADPRVIKGCSSSKYFYMLKKSMRRTLDKEMLNKNGIGKGLDIESINDLSYQEQQRMQRLSFKNSPIAGSIAKKDLNYAIKDLLEVADPHCMEIAKKFPREYKYRVYVLCVAGGERMQQIAESAPIIFAHISNDRKNITSSILRGDKLSKTMELAKIPYNLRNLPARNITAYRDTVGFLSSAPKAFESARQFMPDNKNSRISYFQLSAGIMRHIQDIFERDNYIDFGHERMLIEYHLKVHHWIMRNYEAMDQYIKSLTDFRRVRGHALRVRTHLDHIRDYFMDLRRVARPGFGFEKVALHTVQDLVTVWDEGNHRRYVYDNPCSEREDVGNFSTPWIEEQIVKVKDVTWKFVPLTSHQELMEEGSKQHHCIACYGDRVKKDQCYIYSLRKDGKRDVTIEINRRGGVLKVSQARAVCNEKPSDKAMKVIKKWIDQNNQIRVDNVCHQHKAYLGNREEENVVHI